MTAVSFEEARACVIRELLAHVALHPRSMVTIPLEEADGRVLAETVLADRDYPPMARSMRDGFAVRAVDVPGRLWVKGEVRAGQTYQGTVDAGEAVEIMTGAPMPRGADQVVMVEETQRDGDYVLIQKTAGASWNTKSSPSPNRAKRIRHSKKSNC